MDESAVITETPTSAINALHRMGERVATLEEGMRSLRASVEVIRATDHEINGHMQRFVIAEQQCQANLAALTSQVTKLTESMLPLSAGVAEFQRMHGELVDVVSGFERRRGVASFGKKLVAVIGGIAALLTLISTLFLGIFWMLQHIQVRA